VLLIVKPQNLNVKQCAKSLNAIGSVINQIAQNQNVNWYVKIQIVFQKLNAATVHKEGQESLQLFPSLKKLKKNPNCCGCQKPLRLITPNDANTSRTSQIVDYGTSVVEYNTATTARKFNNPVQIGDAYYERPDDLFKSFDKTAAPLIKH